MELKTDLRFQEVQRFRQIWLFAGILVLLLAELILFGSGIHKQFIQGKPWGSKPMSDTGLIIFSIIGIGIPLLLLILFLNTRLITEVRQDGLYIKFFPFHIRYHKIELENVQEIQPLEYSPLKDYGGWGIRYGAKGKAYNVSGKEGVKIFYTNGKALLIGSQKKEDLAHAIKSWMGNNNP